MSADLVTGMAYLTRHWFRKRAETELLKAAPRLREMPRENELAADWSGPVRNYSASRGKAYAIVCWSAEDIHRRYTIDRAAFVKETFTRLDEGVRELGHEIDRRLRGEGASTGGWEEALRAAGDRGTGIATERLNQADPGDVFLYLGGLPILHGDDGMVVQRHHAYDSILVALKVYGNAVPGSAAP